MIERKKIHPSTYIVTFVVIMIASFYLSGLFTFSDLTFDNAGNKLTEILLHFWQFRRWTNDKTIICMMLGVFVWLYITYYMMFHYRNFQGGKEYGTEDWADLKDVNLRRADKDPNNNRILTKNVSVATHGGKEPSNNNMLVMALPGGGKTAMVAASNILKCNHNIIFLDVKGDSQFKYGLYFSKMGYAVRSLNLKTPEKSDRYNPFEYIENDKDLVRLIEFIYSSLEPDEVTANDPFWDEGPKLCLMSIFSMEQYQAKKENRKGSLNNVLRYLNDLTTPSGEPAAKKGAQPPSKYDKLIREVEAETSREFPPVRDYYKFINGASETVRSIIIIIYAKFKYLELPELRRIFEDDDMHIRDYGYGVGGTKDSPTDKKVITFLCADDTDPSLNFVFSMYYSQASNILCRIADDDFKDRGSKLPIPVGFYLDEFYAGARPMNTDILLATIRSRNIYMVVFVQSKSQLDVVFQEKKSEAVMDTFATFVFYGAAPASNNTHEWISTLCGDTWVDTVTDSSQNGGTGMNYGKKEARLISAAAVKRMPSDECIVFVEGEAPIYDKKYKPWEDPASPFHDAMRVNKESKEGGYVHPVEVIWDEKSYRYITKEKEIEDANELTIDPDSYEFLHMDLTELDFWTLQECLEKLRDDKDELSQKIIAAHEIGNDVPIVGTQKDISGTLMDVWMRYYDSLSLKEQEEIIRASELGMPEDVIKKMFTQTYEEMCRTTLLYKYTSQSG